MASTAVGAALSGLSLLAMTSPIQTPMTFLGIVANVAAACFWLVALLVPRLPWKVLQPLRKGYLRPLSVAVAMHWLLYFGPINIGALLVQSNVQELYSWVIRRPLMAAAALHSLVAYGLILVLLAAIAALLERLGLNQQLQLTPRWPPQQLLLVAALLVLISALIAPVIGTIGANSGAWVDGLPWLLRPWAKGLFLIEAVPLIAAGWQVMAADAAPQKQQRGPLLLLVVLQFLTFILLRQRFLSLLAVLWVLAWFLRWWRKPQLCLWLVFGLSLAYAMPTALRYARVARAPGQALHSYLAQSWQNFATGLQPQNLAASALNDFSYNKAGMASLSVVLDLRRIGVLQGNDSWAWIFADLYRATPGALKPTLAEWGTAAAESSVTRALGIGLPGWSNPGVSLELAQGWVVDLMETPLLDPVAAGGWGGLLSFSVLTALLLILYWSAVCWLNSRWHFFWLLPVGTLSVVGMGPSWLGDLLVLTKVATPWIILTAAAILIAGKLPP